MLALWLAAVPLWGLAILLGVLAPTVEYDVIAVIFNRDVANRVMARQVEGILKFGFLAPFRLLGFIFRRRAR